MCLDDTGSISQSCIDTYYDGGFSTTCFDCCGTYRYRTTRQGCGTICNGDIMHFWLVMRINATVQSTTESVWNASGYCTAGRSDAGDASLGFQTLSVTPAPVFVIASPGIWVPTDHIALYSQSYQHVEVAAGIACASGCFDVSAGFDVRARSQVGVFGAPRPPQSIAYKFHYKVPAAEGFPNQDCTSVAPFTQLQECGAVWDLESANVTEQECFFPFWFNSTL
jgi:hypothetical protein